MTDYTAHMAMHARLSRGGYLFTYTLRYRGEEIGSITVLREKRTGPVETKYWLGEQQFPSAAALKAAHQERLRGIQAAPERPSEE